MDVYEKARDELGIERIDWYAAICLGEDRLDELQRLTDAYGDGFSQGIPLQIQATYWRWLGRIFGRLGNSEAAFGWLDQAIELFERLESRIDLGRALYIRAEVLEAAGKVEAACTDLRDAMELFTACQAQRDANKTEQRQNKMACQ